MTVVPHKSILIRLACLLVAVVFFSVNLPVFAQSNDGENLPQDDIDAIYRDSVHYKLPTPGGDSCGTGTIALSGDSNAAKAFNFLTGKGLTPEQAAGVIGNLYAESGIIPTRKQGEPVSYKATVADIREAIRLNKADSSQGFGVGIAQWTTWTRLQGLLDLAGDNNPLTLEVQLPFLWKELPSNGLDELKKANDLRQATWIFLAFFERPATVVNANLAGNPHQPTSGPAKETLDERVRGAQAILNRGGGGESTNTTSGTEGCDSGGGTFGSALNGNESLPSFKKNPRVQVDDPPHVAFNPSQCTGGFTPGATNLSKILLKTYRPPVTSIGGYACRQNTADITISIHGLGRAMDIMVDATTPKGLETGNRIRNLLINNAAQVGIQRVIWNHHIWSADQDGWRPYTGPDPHTSHVHAEINKAASRNPNLGE